MLPAPPDPCVNVGAGVDTGGRNGVLGAVLVIAGPVERPSPAVPPMAP